jgi:hypothetical protein
MVVFLASIFGLVVACVIFVLGRMFVGSAGNISEQPASQSEVLVSSNISPDEARAKGESADPIEAPHVVAVAAQLEIKPKKRTRKRSTDLSQGVVTESQDLRPRKPRKTTLPGTDVVQ